MKTASHLGLLQGNNIFISFSIFFHISFLIFFLIHIRWSQLECLEHMLASGKPIDFEKLSGKNSPYPKTSTKEVIR